MARITVLKVLIITWVLLEVHNSLKNDILYVYRTNGTSIIGRKLYTMFEKNPFLAFWKIPYAELPGQQRFKEPTPIPWFTESGYNYSNPYNESCSFSEDCLYLSIYTPLIEGPTNFPIIVWIDTDSYKHGPDFLIDEEVIVIAVSFRHSIFGFLNTEDDFALGNMGAKDVIAALKWIRSYISYFNGDTNRVTVFGSGATANIAASLLLSPLGEDLFNRVIFQGGSGLSPADYKSYNFEIANKLYWNLNGPFKKLNRTKLYKLLSEKSYAELLAASQNLFDSSEVRDNQRLINCFGPSIEISAKTPFMSKSPLEVYKQKITNNAVQVMIGYTNLLSLHELNGFVNNKKLLKYLNYNFQYLLPFEGKRDEYGSKQYKKIRKKIMDFYFANGTIGERSLRRYAKYVSDQVIYPALRQARLHAQVSYNNVYLYRFTFKGLFNLVWKTFLRNLELSGATAGDEICYQFKCKLLNDDAYNTNGNEKLFIKKIARLLGNFVKHGNPTPKETDYILGNLQWTPLSPHEGMRGLNMGNKFKMINVPEQKRMRFWDQLQEDFFHEPYVRDEL